MKNPLLIFLVLGIAAAVSIPPALAQTTKLPAVSRTVFKCAANGKVSYSDEPCLGAERIDVEPTRGMNKSSGKELTGQDVRREHKNELFAEAVRPLTGKDATQLEVQKRRMKLTASSRSECASLDRNISTSEPRTASLAGQARTQAQQELLILRWRFAAIGC